MKSLEEHLVGFKFQFGNENHIQVMKLLDKLKKEKKKVKEKHAAENKIKKLSASEQEVINLEERIKGLLRKDLI